MSVVRFTDETIAAIPAATVRAQDYYWDARTIGFGICVGRTGTKRYVVRAAIDGRKCRAVIGVVGELSLDAARAMGIETLARISSGEDINAGKERSRRARKANRPVVGIRILAIHADQSTTVLRSGALPAMGDGEAYDFDVEGESWGVWLKRHGEIDADEIDADEAQNAGTIEISDRLLEDFKLPSGVKRSRLWDATLTGFGVTIGRRRVSFVAKRRVNGRQTIVTIGNWHPAMRRDAIPDSLTTQAARSRAGAVLAVMRAGAVPVSDGAPF